MTRNRSSRPDPQSIHDLDPTTPHTNAQPFADILAARLTRRDTLRGGLSLAATTIFAGAGLSACSDSDNNSSAPTLSFTRSRAHRPTWSACPTATPRRS